MSGIFAKKLCRLHPVGEGPIYWTDITILTGSVADPGCLSRILVLSISGPGSKNSKTKEKSEKNVCPTYLISVLSK
jgi:hypothetical protein